MNENHVSKLKISNANLNLQSKWKKEAGNGFFDIEWIMNDTAFKLFSKTETECVIIWKWNMHWLLEVYCHQSNQILLDILK